mgnify:CR=1 FL=1
MLCPEVVGLHPSVFGCMHNYFLKDTAWLEHQLKERLEFLPSAHPKKEMANG